MAQKKQKNSNSTLVLFAIILIVLTVAFSCIGYYAWAKYTKSKPGDAVAEVAKWHFELTPGSVEGTPRSNFAYTRTDGYGDVATDKLAPGTFGIIPIEIDTTKTEVTMTYDIKVQIQNCPKNIVFYTDEAKTNALTKKEIDENTIELAISKYLPLGELDKKHDETIYWNWPYQTYESDGAGGQSSTKGDTQDTKDQGKDVTITITATGTEVLENPYTLGKMAKIGDTINYTKNGTQVKGIVVNKTDSLVEFMPVYTEDDVDVAEVYGKKITEDYVGKAVLVGNLRLGYNDGETNSDSKKNQAIASWNSAEESVNNEAKKGFNDKYGYYGASRALTVEDVNRLTGFDPTTDYSSITYNKTYTTSLASGDRRFIVDNSTTVKTTDNEVLKATELEGIKAGDTVKLGEETYGGKIISEITMTCTEGKSTNAYYKYNNSSTYKLSKYFCSDYFWLASRCINFYTRYCSVFVRGCNSHYVEIDNLYLSNGNTYGYYRPAVPVVSLSSNIPVKVGATNVEWNVNE